MRNLTEMYIELREPIFGYLLRLSGDYELAEELTQETFLRALQALPKFRQDSSLKTWLYAIARNTYLGKVSKEHPKGIVLTPFAEECMESGESYSDPVEQLLQKEQTLNMRKAISGLPETYRTVIILREFEELSHGEIAKILEKTENWVRVTFYRAKQKLKETYAEFGKEEGK